MARTLRWLAGATVFLAISVSASRVRAQEVDFGNKVLGTLGLNAGTQPSPGVYFGAQSIFYSSKELVDRNGQALPLGFDLDVFGAAFGGMVVVRLPFMAAYYNGSVSVPIAHVTLNTERPEASLDRFGLADVFVQPIQLGWRAGPFELVMGYAFYVPTQSASPGGTDGVSRGHFTHQLSLGSTIYFDSERTWSLSALASFEANNRKKNVDIKRGDAIQIQGGASKQIGPVQVGLAGYALWQVNDDQGADLPPVLAGAREQAFGLGPEINIALPPIRSLLTFRYEHDITVHSRPLGQIFLIGFTFGAYRPATN
jgi:hypothetical protein